MDDYCRSCAGNCCKGLTVFLNAADVSRIRRRGGTDPSAFVDLLPARLGDRDRKAYGFSLGGDERFLIVMKSRRGRCIFLRRVGRKNRCSIHPFRPAVCRCYPFWAETGEPRVVRQALCPEFPPLGASDRRTVRRAFQRLRQESFDFLEILSLWHSDLQAEIWNGRQSGGKAASEFFGFIQRALVALKPC